MEIQAICDFVQIKTKQQQAFPVNTTQHNTTHFHK